MHGVGGKAGWVSSDSISDQRQTREKPCLPVLSKSLPTPYLVRLQQTATFSNKTDSFLCSNAQSWIFIIEGLMTFVVACVSPWLIDDFPDDSKFLTPEEKVFVVARLKKDQGASGEAVSSISLVPLSTFSDIVDFRLSLGVISSQL